VYVTWLPSFPYHHLVSVCARLARCGFKPVPHVAARRLADAASADDFLARLAFEAGVDQALVIAGDLDRPAGPYGDAAALFESGLLQRHGIRRVGLAVYPEGHPAIPEATLAAALERKLALAEGGGLETFLMSQLCFQAEPILQWLERLRQAGVRQSVRLGLPGPASVRTLINFGMRCGVGASLRAIKSHGISLTRLAAQTGPEALVASLAEVSLPQDVQLHFFSFGGFERTARWMSAAAHGEVDFEHALTR
jgi:methylenetetrahydrofolate reductase (NADPH)